MTRKPGAHAPGYTLAPPPGARRQRLMGGDGPPSPSLSLAPAHPLKGFRHSTPVLSTCLTLRVTRVRPWTLAVAASRLSVPAVVGAPLEIGILTGVRHREEEILEGLLGPGWEERLAQDLAVLGLRRSPMAAARIFKAWTTSSSRFCTINWFRSLPVMHQ